MDDKRIQRSLRYLQIESTLTVAVLSMPTMTIFFSSIGMGQKLIGLSQAAFTLAVLMTDVPTGWIADRFSRRRANLIGDGLAAFGFLIYALAQGFWSAVLAEIVIGIGIAFTNGADMPLLAAYCKQLDLKLDRVNGQIQVARPFVEAAGLLIGGFIGAYSPRLALLATVLPFLVGAWLSSRLVELGARRERRDKHPIRDMFDIVKATLHGQRDLAWASLAAALQREVTHAVVWVYTPILLLAGAPPWMVASAWSFNMLMTAAGSWVAKRWSRILTDAETFIASMSLTILACLLLAWKINLLTVWLYGALGLSRGWAMVTTPLMIQRKAPEDAQSTVHSVASSLARLLYLPLVIVINAAGGHNPSRAFLINAVVFAPLTILTFQGMRRRSV